MSADALSAAQAGSVAGAVQAGATSPAAAAGDDAAGFGAILESLLRFDGERENPFAFAAPQAERAAGTIHTIGQFAAIHRPEESAFFGPRKWSALRELVAVLDREVLLSAV